MATNDLESKLENWPQITLSRNFWPLVTLYDLETFFFNFKSQAVVSCEDKKLNSGQNNDFDIKYMKIIQKPDLKKQS